LQPVVAPNPFLAGLRGNSSHRSLKLHPALKDYPAREAGAEARSHPGPAGGDEVVCRFARATATAREAAS
jgi:hypothetical protein